MNYRILILMILTMMPTVARAYSWGDFLDDLESVVDDAGEFFQDAGEWIEKRFSDTKVTRKIDYEVRHKALIVAKEVATKILQALQEIADTTLEIAYETANAGVTISKEFLDKVVENVAYGVLKGPAEAAKGIIEGAKQTSVGVLEGSQWVVNQSLGTLDVTCIHYDGNLQDLARLKLGNVRVEGVIIKPFTLSMELDLTDPVSTVGSFAKALGEQMGKIFIEPFEKKVEQETKVPLNQALAQVTQGAQQASDIEKKLEGVQEPQALLENQRTMQEMYDTLERKKKEIYDITLAARDSIKKAAALGIDQLLEYLKTKELGTDREVILFRQELNRKKLEFLRPTPVVKT